MKNLCVEANGGSIESFTSQYHHESRAINLLDRNPGLVWFTSVSQQLPQHVIFRVRQAHVRRVGIYVHGENNQNPKHIRIFLADSEGEQWTQVVDEELEQRAGDFLWDCDVANVVRAKFEVTDNYGGSGIHISKCFVFGE